MSASKGYVYVMSNPSLGKNVYKIGASVNHPAERAKQLSASTSVPSPFTLVYHRRVVQPFQVEAAIHTALNDYRVNQSREFFSIPLYQIIMEIEKYPTLPKHSVRDMKLPFSELFASFPDDGSDRELTLEERKKCQALWDR